jgi:protoporphyrinogen IX oxidase
MMEVLNMVYLWLKSAHLIFVIFWMAGLFMLPRFFVYHQESAIGSDEDTKWVERERRLIRIILNPAMIVVWVFGLLLAYNIGAFSQGWFHAKLLIVLALSGYHGWMIGYAKKLARGERILTDKKLRLLNEVPGIAAAVTVILVIVKPF